MTALPMLEHNDPHGRPVLRTQTSLVRIVPEYTKIQAVLSYAIAKILEEVGERCSFIGM